ETAARSVREGHRHSSVRWRVDRTGYPGHSNAYSDRKRWRARAFLRRGFRPLNACAISPERAAETQYWGPPGLTSLFHSRIPPAIDLTSLKPALRSICVTWSDRAPLRQWTTILSFSWPDNFVAICGQTLRGKSFSLPTMWVMSHSW